MHGVHGYYVFSVFGLVCPQLAIPARYKRLPTYLHDSPTNRYKKKKDFWLATVKNPAVSPSDATGMQAHSATTSANRAHFKVLTKNQPIDEKISRDCSLGYAGFGACTTGVIRAFLLSQGSPPTPCKFFMHGENANMHGCARILRFFYFSASSATSWRSPRCTTDCQCICMIPQRADAKKKKKDFWLATVKNPAAPPSGAPVLCCLHRFGLVCHQFASPCGPNNYQCSCRH